LDGLITQGLEKLEPAEGGEGSWGFIDLGLRIHQEKNSSKGSKEGKESCPHGV